MDKIHGLWSGLRFTAVEDISTFLITALWWKDTSSSIPLAARRLTACAYACMCIIKGYSFLLDAKLKLVSFGFFLTANGFLNM